MEETNLKDSEKDIREKTVRLKQLQVMERSYNDKENPRGVGYYA